METKSGSEFCQATLENLDVLFALCRQSYSENFADHWNEGGLEWYLEKVYSREGIKADLQSSDTTYFIAFLDREPAGFMKLKQNSFLSGFSDMPGMEIEKIYFLLQHKGKGLGKQLIKLALEQARKQQAPFIWLGVIDTNFSSIEFYKKVGFRQHDTTRLDIPYFKDELRGMWRMVFRLAQLDSTR